MNERNSKMDFEDENGVDKRTSLEIRNGQAKLIESIVNDDPELDDLLKEYEYLLKEDIIIETGTLCNCATEFEKIPIYDDGMLDKIVQWTRTGMCSCPAETPGQIRERMASISLVHLCVSIGNRELLTRLADKGCDLNKPTYYLYVTPLFMAVAIDSVNMVSALLSKNDVNINLECGPTRVVPLMYALGKGSVQIAKMLLKRKDIDVNVCNRHKETALIMSLRMANEELFTMILEAGANPNEPDSRTNTPLLIAVVRGVNYVRKLIEKGADVNGKNRQLETPLFYATYSESEEIVRELLQAGADIEAECRDGRTILTTAVYQGNAEITKLLLDKGVEISKCNNQGYTAFHIAAWNGHLDIVKSFLEKGAKHDELTNDKNTPLGLAAHGNCPQVIELLLPLGCKVNNADKDLDTAMHYATYNGMTESVKLLMEYGADPDLRNRLNTTPLWNAVYMKHKDVVKLLLAANVDMEVKSSGINQHAQTDNVVLLYPTPVSPFYVAVQRHALDILLLLKTSGYNIYSEEWFYKGEYPEGVDENPNLMAILKQFASTPPRLITICRNFLRKYFGNKLKEKVNELEIPTNLKNYLLLQDFLS